MLVACHLMYTCMIEHETDKLQVNSMRGHRNKPDVFS